jgi:phage N-6-adenine-methyltransferase
MNKNVANLKSTALATHDLRKTLGKIASAEKLEQQCRRARDSAGMFKAIAEKIDEQAKYIVLRDAGMAIARSLIAKATGRGKKSPAGIRLTLPKGDPGQDVADRWRKAFCTKSDAGTEIDFDKVKLALEDARLRCLRICEQQNMGTIRGTEGTGEFERYTPAKYIEAVRVALGEIDLDPATSNQAQETVRALQYYTEKDDGLALQWEGRVFLNPPYHRELAPAFIDKLVAEFAAGRVTAAILLVNNCTDTDWFDAAVRSCAGICFTHGRIKFHVPKGDDVLPTQGQAFLYFGNDVQRFEDTFCIIGFCVRPTRQFEQK